MDAPSLRLSTGADIPQLGPGMFQVPPDATAATVRFALSRGYRSVDTAAAYGNEAGVRAAIAGSGVPGERVFVTTKLWNEDRGCAAHVRCEPRAAGARLRRSLPGPFGPRDAAAHDKASAQVILRWHLQLRNVAIPKSVTRERIEQNIGVLDFELTDDEMDQIAALDCSGRIGPHPDSFGG